MEDHTVGIEAMCSIAVKIPKARCHAVSGYGHELGIFMLDTRLDDLAALPLPDALAMDR